jgi:hypothetical protein
MEHSPSWETNSSSANQEIPRILWNLKVYYVVLKNLPALNRTTPRPTTPLYISWFLYNAVNCLHKYFDI